MRAGHLKCSDVGFACVWQDVCVYSKGESSSSGFLLVRITADATHRPKGSGQKSVGSLNPVNVEQHLIRSALQLHQATTLHDTKCLG